MSQLTVTWALPATAATFVGAAGGGIVRAFVIVSWVEVSPGEVAIKEIGPDWLSDWTMI